MRREIHTLAVTIAALLAVPLVSAQTLTLFEPTETDAAQANQPALIQPVMIPGGNGQPAFTLRSTSRIGDRYNVVLVNRDGAIAKVSWQSGQRVEVPGYSSFAITNVEGRSVSLAHPDGDACASAPDKGVDCAAGNLALLTLARSTPVVATAQQPAGIAPAPGVEDPFAAAAAAAAANGVQPQPAVLNAGVNVGPGQQVIINPFSGQPEVVQAPSPEEQAARASRQQQRAARLQQFTPPTINDADVPAGMRKVSTPFGDRLIPIRQ